MTLAVNILPFILFRLAKTRNDDLNQYCYNQEIVELKNRKLKDIY